MIATLRRRTAPPESLDQSAITALKLAPLTRGLSPAALDLLARDLQEQSFLPGHRVLTEGFSGQEFFIIIEGQAAVSVDGWQVALLGPGDFFGEIALLDEGLRFATITADTQLRCLVLANAELERVLIAHPQLALNLLREMVRRFRDTVGKGRAMVAPPAETPVAGSLAGR